MRAVVNFSSDALDTDVTVKLLDVFPDGRAMNMVEGITRPRYRDGYDKPRIINTRPGEHFYDSILLNPTHAEAQISLRVLTAQELAFVDGPLATVANMASTYSKGLREVLALANPMSPVHKLITR